MIKNFIEYLKNHKKYSQNTIQAYYKDLMQFYDFVQLDYSQIITDHLTIRKWIAHLAKNGYSNNSIGRKISALKSYYKFLVKNNFISKNPTDKIIAPKISKNLPDFIPYSHLKNLTYDLNNLKFPQLRQILIFELFYQTGIRRNELLNLKIDDINFEKNFIKVTGKGNKQRIIPISEKLKKLILFYLEKRNQLSDSEYLIVSNKGNKPYEKLIYRDMRNFLGQITSVKKKSPHTIRHTFATALLNNGASIRVIKDLLGHENITTTQKYTHTSIKQLYKIYKQAHPRA